MTRPSRRELESAVADVTEDTGPEDLGDATFRFVCDGEETPDSEPDLVTVDGFAFYTGEAEP